MIRIVGAPDFLTELWRTDLRSCRQDFFSVEPWVGACEVAQMVVVPVAVAVAWAEAVGVGGAFGRP